MGGLVHRFVLSAVIFIALASSPTLARAQLHSAGQLTLAGLVATARTPTTPRSTDWGAVAIADLWADFGPLRVGGAMGVAPVTSNGAACPAGFTCDSATTLSRVILPIGASVALSLHTDSHVAVDVRLRGGVWAGATDFGLAMDAWGSLGLWLGYELGERATAYVGVDLWVVRAQTAQDEITPSKKAYDASFFVAPGLSISWLP